MSSQLLILVAACVGLSIFWLIDRWKKREAKYKLELGTSGKSGSKCPKCGNKEVTVLYYSPYADEWIDTEPEGCQKKRFLCLSCWLEVEKQI